MAEKDQVSIEKDGEQLTGYNDGSEGKSSADGTAAWMRQLLSALERHEKPGKSSKGKESGSFTGKAGTGVCLFPPLRV